MNRSFGVCRDIITILEDIFKNEKSARILIAVSVNLCFNSGCRILC